MCMTLHAAVCERDPAYHLFGVGAGDDGFGHGNSMLEFISSGSVIEVDCSATYAIHCVSVDMRVYACVYESVYESAYESVYVYVCESESECVFMSGP